MLKSVKAKRNTRRVAFSAGLAALLLVTACASTPPRSTSEPGLPPSTLSILQWSPEQQAIGYRRIEQIVPVKTIRRGRRVHPLPPAGRTIEPTWTHAGQSWTVDSYMQANRVSGVLVIKDGKVLLERYALGRAPTDRWTSFSVAKSVTSTLVGAAIKDGKIRSLQDPVTDYLPELKGSAYDGVTVRQLLMMSSGVRWNEDYTDPNSDVARTGALTAGPDGINPIVKYMGTLPRANAPGTKFTYNTGETDLVGVLVSRATGKPLAEYASEKIWRPYGMEQDGIWMTDTAGHERGGCCMSMTLRDYGRIGQFILDGGVANGRPMLPDGWTREATRVQIPNGQPAPAGYGYFWWIRGNGAYEATGIFGQGIATFPEDRLIIVSNAAWPRATGADLSAARTAFVEAVRAAARE